MSPTPRRSRIPPLQDSAPLVVLDDPADWGLAVPGVRIVDAHSYLTDQSFSDRRRAKVFNLCRSYRYQTLGYYVSLLAAARGHRPLPSVATLQDMRTSSIVRIASGELESLIQRSLAPIRSSRFTLSIYFGRNMAKRYERLSRQLFNIFPSPLLRAQFLRDGRWVLQSLAPVAAKDIPRSHRAFVAEAASLHFAGRGTRRRSKTPHRWDLAILVRPDDPEPPSDARALKRFARAAEDLGLRPTFIEKQDQGRLAEFDALFIRETTYVNHHTYRFAAKAETEGLVVMDDPGSIIRCTNKVYLEEALRRRDVPRPRTLIVHSGNVEDVIDSLGLPCVLKRPDSSFSAGVVRVDSEDELRIEVQRMLRESELVVAQEYARTDWDWRVGVLDRKPLFACRYGMAPGHWQVINRQVDDDDDARYGDFETVRIEDAPPALIRMALRAAEVMGDSLYGVDLKEIAGRFIVMEVNDNPNIDSGVEDAVLGDELYARVMRVFLERIERRGTRSPVASTPRQAGEAP